MKLAACLSIGLAASMFSAADAQAVRWKSQDGAISLTVPAIWAHDSAPPDTIDDAGSMVMVTWVRKPPSAKEDPLCEVYRSRVPSGVSTLPTADFVALTRQMLDTEEAQSSGLINNEIISTDRMVSGRPVIDYKTYTFTASSAASAKPRMQRLQSRRSSTRWRSTRPRLPPSTSSGTRSLRHRCRAHARC